MSTEHTAPVTGNQSPVTDHRSPTTGNRQPTTGHRSPPICYLRSFDVYEMPGSRELEIHLTADHGATIAWRMGVRKARALGLSTYRKASAAIRAPLPVAGEQPTDHRSPPTGA